MTVRKKTYEKTTVTVVEDEKANGALEALLLYCTFGLYFLCRSILICSSHHHSSIFINLEQQLRSLGRILRQQTRIVLGWTTNGDILTNVTFRREVRNYWTSTRAVVRHYSPEPSGGILITMAVRVRSRVTVCAIVRTSIVVSKLVRKGETRPNSPHAWTILALFR